MMTSTIRKFGVGVASLAMVAGAAAPAMADPRPPAPRYDISQLRLSGEDRVQTAIELAKHVFDGKTDRTTAKVVYLAGYNGEVDAAAAGSLPGGPILLVKEDGSSNEKVAEAVKGFGVDKVVAIGGSKVVPEEVLKAVGEKAGGGITTERIDGKDRYETSVNIAKAWSMAHSGSLPGRVILANGTSLVDALTSGALDNPILLMNADGSIPDVVRAYIKQVKPQAFTAIGGTAVIPENTVLDAQYTALGSAEFTSDDSLANIQKKKNDYGRKIATGGSLKVNADTANDEANIAKALNEGKWAEINSAVGELTAAVKGYRAKLVAEHGADNVDLDASTPDVNEKRWNIDLLVKNRTQDDTGSQIQTKLLALDDLLNSYYALTSDKALDFANEDPIKAALSIDAAGNVSVKKDDLYKKAIKDLVDSNEKGIKAYNDSDTDGDGVGDASKLDGDGKEIAKAFIVDGSGSATLAATYSPLAVAEITKYYADAANAQLESARSTYAYLIQQERNIVDKLDGKSYLRLWGKDRYATSAAIADWIYQREGQIANNTNNSEERRNLAKKWGSENAYIVNGSAFADAVVAGTVMDGPILLVSPAGTISTDVNKELVRGAKKEGGPLQVWAIGGKKVITDATLQTANNIALVGEPDQNVVRENNAVSAEAMSKNLVDVVADLTDENKFTIELPVKVNGNAAPSKIPADITVVGSPAGVTTAAEAGKVKVDVTAGTTPYGTYTVTFKVDGVSGVTTFTYAAGTIDEVADTATSDNTLKYEVDATSINATQIKELKTDGTTDAASGVSISGSDVVNGTDATGADKNYVLLTAANKIVKVFKAGADQS